MFNLKIVVKIMYLQLVGKNRSALEISKMPFVTSMTFLSKRAKVLTVYKSLPNISKD